MASRTSDLDEMELEMHDEESEFSFEMKDEGEYGASGSGLEPEFEAPTNDNELEADNLSAEFELDEEAGTESQDHESDDSINRLAERLYEFSNEGFESEYEADERLAEIFNDAERDFFFGNLFKIAKSAIGNKLGNLVNKIPVLGKAVQVGTSLLRGDIKGALGTLVKSGLLKSALSAIPGAGPVIAALEPALKAAGVQLEVADTDEGRKQFANDIAYVTRESYDYLAKTLSDPTKQMNLLNPIQSNKLANKAIIYGLKQAGATGRPSFSKLYRHNGHSRRVRRVYIRRGEAVKIISV